MSLRSRALLALSLALAGCAVRADEGPIAEAAASITVQQAAADTTACATSSVKGLSEQVIAKAACIVPGAYVLVPDRPNLSLGGAELPYLEAPARDALVAALDEHAGTTMTVNSMLRTVVQQYLLYQWYQDGVCGIGLAATPGNSNHETGLALDVSEYGTWQSALEAHGFAWLGSNDPVHFDYTGADAIDYRGTDVLAFQKLWNENNPGDLIDEDGAYGPQTKARIQASPADGFAIAPSCGGGGSGGSTTTTTTTTTTSTTTTTTTNAGGAGGGPTGGGGSPSTGGDGGGGGDGEGGGAAETNEGNDAKGCACGVAGAPEGAAPRPIAALAAAFAIGSLVRRRRSDRPSC